MVGDRLCDFKINDRACITTASISSRRFSSLSSDSAWRKCKAEISYRSCRKSLFDLGLNGSLRTFLRISNASGARAWGVLSGCMTISYTHTYMLFRKARKRCSACIIGMYVLGVKSVQAALTEGELSVFLLDSFCCRFLVYI